MRMRNSLRNDTLYDRENCHRIVRRITWVYEINSEELHLDGVTSRRRLFPLQIQYRILEEDKNDM